jgi:competence protein ComEC
VLAPRPDVLVSGAGDVIAVRGADAKLSGIKFGSDTLSLREWLAADGDDRASTDRAVAAGFACDPDGCVARLADGRAVALSRTAAALADDCARAALVVTLRPVPSDCGATVLDRKALQRGGATALTRRTAGDGFEVTQARPAGFDRPWAREREMARPAPAPTAPAEQRNATPPPSDSDAEE